MRAFTLLEVMIALAVVGIGLVAASSSIAQLTRNGIYLRDKTLGHWIAMNKLAEMRLAEAWPSIGKSDDDIEYAGQDWHWNAEVTATDVETLRRIDVTVARKEDKHEEQIVARLAGFVGQPRFAGGLPAPWTGTAQPGQDGQPGAQHQPQNPGNGSSDQDSGDEGDAGEQP
jgi:type II secretion system protein I